jgi:hypothetical protein
MSAANTARRSTTPPAQPERVRGDRRERAPPGRERGHRGAEDVLLALEIADWNPVSAVAAAARELFGNPNPSASIGAWPMQHTIAASLMWSVALLVAFGPLATTLDRRRTTA